MPKLQLNQLMKAKQVRTTFVVVGVIILGLTMLIVLLADGKKKPIAAKRAAVNLTGIIDESFSNANVESAQVAQQQEVDDLKKQIAKLNSTISELGSSNAKKINKLSEEFSAQMRSQMQTFNEQVQEKVKVQKVAQQQLWHNPKSSPEFTNFNNQNIPKPSINFVSFNYHKPNHLPRLHPGNYVSANTSVRAVVLGGADADASVTGEQKHNAVMLFKLLDNVALPNGKQSHLRGCRISAFTWGDISSERAFAELNRIFCAPNGKDIIDLPVHGWVFFNGKVGIKGEPLMRDGKVLAAAGIAGGLSGIAQAAQASLPVENFNNAGVYSFVPSNRIIGFTAAGGAANAASTLAQHYIKRSEQYHPVIQIGAGNVVTIVFKDGFYLEPEIPPKKITNAGTPKPSQNSYENYQNHYQNPNVPPPPEVFNSPLSNLTVPNEVLEQIDRANVGSRMMRQQP